MGTHQKNINAIFTYSLNPKQAKILHEALKIEGDQQVPGTSVQTSHDKDVFTLNIFARRTSSLRACANSYMNWINMIIGIFHELKNTEDILQQK